VRSAHIGLAVAALVAIGAAEALVSAQQLAAQPGRSLPALSAEGTALTLVGFAVSVAIYLALGRTVALAGGTERAALVEGGLTGALAGALGGSIRAVAVSGFLGDQLARVGLGTEFASLLLGIFVLGAVAVSAVGGAALCWLGLRFSRRRLRPRP
jgi:hypothetical protein